MKAVVFSTLVAVSGMVMFGCSQEGRKEAIDRTSNAMNVLNGGDKSVEQEHETPLVVQEQQKKETEKGRKPMKTVLTSYCLDNSAA